MSRIVIPFAKDQCVVCGHYERKEKFVSKLKHFSVHPRTKARTYSKEEDRIATWANIIEKAKISVTRPKYQAKFKDLLLYPTNSIAQYLSSLFVTLHQACRNYILHDRASMAEKKRYSLPIQVGGSVNSSQASFNPLSIPSCAEDSVAMASSTSYHRIDNNIVEELVSIYNSTTNQPMDTGILGSAANSANSSVVSYISGSLNSTSSSFNPTSHSSFQKAPVPPEQELTFDNFREVLLLEMFHKVAESPARALTWDELYAYYCQEMTVKFPHNQIGTNPYISQLFTAKFVTERRLLVKDTRRPPRFRLANAHDDIMANIDSLSDQIKENLVLDNFSNTRKILEKLPSELHRTVLTNALNEMLAGGACSTSRGFIHQRIAAEMAFNWLKKTTVVQKERRFHRYTKARNNIIVLRKALETYCLSRSKTQIEAGRGVGSCVSYGLVQEFVKTLMDKLESSKEKFGDFIPMNLRPRLPVVFHMDNYDQGLFHGTLMIAIQTPPGPSSQEPIGMGPMQEAIDKVLPIREAPEPVEMCANNTEASETKTIDANDSNTIEFRQSQLNESASNVYSLDGTTNEPSLPSVTSVTKHPNLPITAPVFCSMEYSSKREQFSSWLREFSTNPAQLIGYYAPLQETESLPRKHTVGMWPLMRDPTNLQTTFAFVYKSFLANRALCPSFPLVLGGDMPVYVMIKKITWSYPEWALSHPEFSVALSRAIVIPGLLHHEFHIFKCIAKFIGQCGLATILQEAGIIGKGKVAQFTEGRGCMTLCRNLCVALLLGVVQARERAYHKYGGTDQEFSQWLNTCEASNSTYNFFRLFEEMVLTLLMLVKGQRFGDFREVRAALTNALHYYFAFGKFYYARWTTVFLAEMELIEQEQPTRYACLAENIFVNLGLRKHSQVAMDFTQETVHRILKKRQLTTQAERRDHQEAERSFWTVQPVLSAFLDLDWDGKRYEAEQDDAEHVLEHHSSTPGQIKRLADWVDAIANVLVEKDSTIGFLDPSSHVFKNFVTGEEIVSPLGRMSDFHSFSDPRIKRFIKSLPTFLNPWPSTNFWELSNSRKGNVQDDLMEPAFPEYHEETPMEVHSENVSGQESPGWLPPVEQYPTPRVRSNRPRTAPSRFKDYCMEIDEDGLLDPNF